MNALGQIIAARIRENGPMTLADYMAECLLHPEHGYYTTRQPFGAAGDFTTAPEISQMFGELLGLALAQAWMDQGAPARFTLAELGPGRGTLMADVLRATRGVPGFHAAAEIVLVEASPRLREMQAKAVEGAKVRWETSIDALSEAPLYLLANEFFDALPIRQFSRVGHGWAETVVGLAGNRLVLGRTPPVPLAALEDRLADIAEGEVVETCPAAAPVMAAIAARIAAHGGMALVVDYGGWQSRGDTFQALRGHAYADPLASPGEADLTAHVDFAALAAAAEGCATAYATQGDLLARLGIAERSRVLAARMEGERLESHLAATHRLTAAEEMGSLFKALAVTPSGAPPPPGFA